MYTVRSWTKIDQKYINYTVYHQVLDETTQDKIYISYTVYRQVLDETTQDKIYTNYTVYRQVLMKLHKTKYIQIILYTGGDSLF